MFKVARFATLLGLGLATSSFLGLVARHVPPVGVGLWVVLLLMLLGLLMAYFAGPLLDNHFGWGDDTSLGLAIALFLVFLVGGFIGWLIA